LKNRLKSALIAASVTCALVLAVFAETDIRVYVNGERVNEDIIIRNDRTYIPLRAVGEALGANVEWNDETRSANITFTEENAVAKIVEDISPSVVTIVGNYTDTDSAADYNNLTSHGSGVIYKSNGHILTNAHVVKDIKNLTVVLNDGQSIAGKVLYCDELADIAVIKINKIGLKPISFADESTIQAGQTAIAIGTPISLSMRNSVTKGIVSGNGVTLNGSHYKLLQTDAAINPGNSGGPLVNISGQLIGINSSKYVSANIDNMGFAIPIGTVKNLINQFETNGKILRPKLDFEFEQSWEARIGLPTVKGLTVTVSSNSQLMKDDIINAVNGITVHSVTDWNEAIKESYNGSTLTINYTRGTQTADITINAPQGGN